MARSKLCWATLAALVTLVGVFVPRRGSDIGSASANAKGEGICNAPASPSTHNGLRSQSVGHDQGTELGSGGLDSEKTGRRWALNEQSENPYLIAIERTLRNAGVTEESVESWSREVYQCLWALEYDRAASQAMSGAQLESLGDVTSPSFAPEDRRDELVDAVNDAFRALRDKDEVRMAENLTTLRDQVSSMGVANPESLTEALMVIRPKARITGD